MPIRVFVADDHSVMREGLRFLLNAHEDIQVIGDAADGRETVRRVLLEKPDVVIMDIAMSELNGIEATKEVRQNCPTAQVVILSMYSTPGYIFRSFEAGALGYLLKETAGKEVADAIRAAHAGKRYLSRGIAETILDDYLKRGRAQEPDPLGRLSLRERELLQLLAEGKSKAEISKSLSLSPKTIDTYRSRLMQKLGLNDLPALVKFAIQNGMTRMD